MASLSKTLDNLSKHVPLTGATSPTSVRLPSEPLATAAAHPSPPVHPVEARATMENHDRKFNIIVFGIDESASGSSRCKRQQENLDKISGIFSSLDNSVSALSVRDNFCLGCFKQDAQKPRPLLVKLSRAADVSSLLSKRTSLSKPIFIRPDLSS